jgi:hypothetical protein
MICFVPTTAYSNPSNRRYLYASPGNPSTAFLQGFNRKVGRQGKSTKIIATKMRKRLKIKPFLATFALFRGCRNS